VAASHAGPPAWLLGAGATAYDGTGEAHPIGLGVQLGGAVTVEGQGGVCVEIRHDNDSPPEGGTGA
jgi:hypothetical protein